MALLLICQLLLALVVQQTLPLGLAAFFADPYLIVFAYVLSAALV